MSAIPEAASIVLARGSDSSEVFVVHRSPALRFFGDYHAFPGGKVSPEDSAVPVYTQGRAGTDPRRAAAAREMFEETGVLIARRVDGSFPTDLRPWDDERRALIEDQLNFADFLRQTGLRLDAEDFALAGSLVTPPFSPIRFDTAFFVAVLPPGQQTEVWPGELDSGFWTLPDAVLASWARSEVLVSPPTLCILELIRHGPALQLGTHLKPLLNRLEAGAIPPIFFAPGVQMIPLRTVGLPPTTYTNAYLVGRENLFLIDPGAHEADEQERLFTLLEERFSTGGQLAAVVLTHQHPDHVGGVNAVASRYRVPVFAHPRTADLLGGRVKVDRFLGEGDRLDLGTAPDGGAGWELEALHTPGHAAGHLAFLDRKQRLLIAGDMVSMLSSVVIAPPDGDLTEYLRSLERLRRLDIRMLLPGHGGASVRPAQVIAECIEHRAKREGQLLAALSSEEARTAAELVDRVYRGIAGDLHRLAGWQVEAGLEKLRREGRLKSHTADGTTRWRLV